MLPYFFLLFLIIVKVREITESSTVVYRNNSEYVTYEAILPTSFPRNGKGETVPVRYTLLIFYHVF